MEIKQKINTKFLFTLIAGLILFLFIREWQHANSENNLISKISAYKTQAKHYQNRFGQQVAYNNQLQFSTTKQLKNFLANNDTIKEILKNFKQIQSVVHTREIITLPKDTFKYTERIPCYFKPFYITKNTDTNYFFRGIISQTDFVLDSLSIRNQQYVVLGRKKTGFLKKQYQVNITNTNPYIFTSNVGAYVVKPEKKWYERNIVHFGAGMAVGFLGVKVLNK